MILLENLRGIINFDENLKGGGGVYSFLRKFSYFTIKKGSYRSKYNITKKKTKLYKSVINYIGYECEIYSLITIKSKFRNPT